MENPSQRIDEIRARLNKFCELNPDYSNKTIGNNVGYSAGYVSLFKNNKFPSKDKELEFAEKVESYLNNIEINRSDEKNYHLKFAMTKAAKEIFIAAGYALRQGEIVLIIGDNGLGKTIALQEINKKNPNDILINVTPVITPRSLLEDLCASLNIPVEYSKDYMLKEIIKKLKGTYRRIMLDECESLTIPALDIMRRIHDFTNTGMIIAGSKKLQDKLNRKRSNLQYLNSRIGMTIKINILDLEDVLAILKVNFPEALKYARNFLQLSKNNGRFLEKLIKLVKDKIDETGAQLDEDLIDLAVGSLLT